VNKFIVALVPTDAQAEVLARYGSPETVGFFQNAPGDSVYYYDVNGSEVVLVVIEPDGEVFTETLEYDSWVRRDSDGNQVDY